jgi:DUF971 family protein
MTSSNAPTKLNIHKKSATLELVYGNGDSYQLSAEYLRVFSPSAEVQGHGQGQAVLQHGKKDVQFLDIQLQGHYAIKITFSDGHDSGIFSWEYLFQLGEDHQENWQQYLAELGAAEKSRSPQFIALGS